MDAPRGTIDVTPVLFCAPVFWTREFWTEATHRWDWVKPETPLAEKPWAELKVSLDVTLGEVIGAACDAWRIEAGPDLLKQGGLRESEFHRFAFVRMDQDARGVDEQVGYSWPGTLPVALEDGGIEQKPAATITYRELLVASKLGLIPGDVRRPYVHPVRPQGGAGSLIEVGRLTLDAIRTAYAGVDDSVGYAAHTLQLVRASLPEIHRVSDEVVDEGVRLAAVVAFTRWLRRELRRGRRGS